MDALCLHQSCSDASVQRVPNPRKRARSASTDLPQVSVSKLRRDDVTVADQSHDSNSSYVSLAPREGVAERCLSTKSVYDSTDSCCGSPSSSINSVAASTATRVTTVCELFTDPIPFRYKIILTRSCPCFFQQMDELPSASEKLDDESGYLVLCPGDTIASYEVRSQCGRGSFGTVYACYDHLNKREVAVKVTRSTPSCWEDALHEIEVLRTVNDRNQDNHCGCIQLLDVFDYHKHKCLVFEQLSKSVYDFMRENRFHPLPATHVWSMAKQLLESVASVHSVGIVHSDLKPENIMLEDTSDFSRRYSASNSDTTYKVLHNTGIQLIDFGSAVFETEYQSTTMSTVYYRAPEIILDLPRSPASDMWSVACILLELHTGAPLFDPRSDLNHLAMIESAIGHMPSNLREHLRQMHPEYFDDDGQLASRCHLPKLADSVRYPSSYDSHNFRFLQLLRRLLQWDPAKRLTAQEALRLPYFSLPPDKFPV